METPEPCTCSIIDKCFVHDYFIQKRITEYDIKKCPCSYCLINPTCLLEIPGMVWKGCDKIYKFVDYIKLVHKQKDK